MEPLPTTRDNMNERIKYAANVIPGSEIAYLNIFETLVLVTCCGFSLINSFHLGDFIDLNDTNLKLPTHKNIFIKK